MRSWWAHRWEDPRWSTPAGILVRIVGAFVTIGLILLVLMVFGTAITSCTGGNGVDRGRSSALEWER